MALLLTLILQVILCPQQGRDLSGPEIYAMGLDILKKEGVEDGIAFFEKHGIDSGSLHALFGLAWANWQKGDLKETEDICHFILGLDLSQEQVIKASTYYLLGHATFNQGAFLNSTDFFEKALVLYEAENLLDNVFKTHLGLAAAFIGQKNFPEAETHLHQALATNSFTDTEMGYFYELKNRIAFARGHFGQALIFARESLDAYLLSDDRNAIAIAENNLGFALLINYHFDEALPLLKKLDAYAKEHDAVFLSYLNTVNWILAHRLKGMYFGDMEAQVRLWIQTYQDENLKSHLEFVLNWDGISKD